MDILDFSFFLFEILQLQKDAKTPVRTAEIKLEKSPIFSK